MTFVPDNYTRRARLYPLLIVAIPIGTTTLAFFPDGFSSWKTLWSLVTWCGGVALLAQLGRDWGKRKEPQLFRTWGGAPTTRRLRFRDAPNPALLAHRHHQLSSMFRDLALPSEMEEADDAARADQVYEACVQLLRDKTRDRKCFPLVFEENCNYGFRRNLWGMKPIGVTTAVLGIIVTLAVGYLYENIASPGVIAVAAINFLLLIIWLFCVTANWVRVPADAYAERLLDSIDGLSHSS